MLRGGDIGDIAVLVPNDVSFFMANRGAGEQHFEFSRMGEILDEAGPRTQYYLDQARKAASPILGFDPLVSANWQATGLSFYRPAGIAIAGDSLDNMRLLFFLPVGKKATLLETLDGIFTRAGGKVDIEKVGEHDLHVVQNLGGFFPLVLNYAEHDDYIVGVFGMQGSFEPVGTLDDIWNMPEADSLMNDKAFKNRLATIGSKWHSLTYTSAEAMELMMMGVGELASMYGLEAASAIPASGGAGIGTTHMTDDAFRYRGAQRMMSSLVEPAWVDGVSGSDKLGSRIAGKALLAVRGSIDLEAIWKSAAAQDLGAEAFLTNMLAEGLDIDIEKDIVKNVEGHISAVVFEPDWDAMTPDFVGYAPLENSPPIANLLDSGCRILSLWGARLEKDESGIWCTDGATSFLGVAHDHLLLGMSPNPAKYRTLEGEGFMSSLPKNAQKGLKSGPPVYLYLNIDESFELAKNQKDFFESMVGESISIPPSTPVQGISASLQLVKSKPETDLEEGTVPYDSRVEVQVLLAEGGIQEWLSQHLEETVVWAEDMAKGLMPDETIAVNPSGINATLKEISDWQIMGAEELGEPYSSCGTEEKAQAIVRGGDPNTVYSNEERACFENIGWIPAIGSIAFWTTTQGPADAPTGFTVFGIEQSGGSVTTRNLQHPPLGQ
jgi:hypothetical protein